MIASAIVDTGPLVAAADRDDVHHRRCVDWFDSHLGLVIVPAPVIVEVCWLLDRRVGPAAEAAFLAGLTGDSPRIEGLIADDYRRSAELVDRYSDLDLGFVDASVVAIAERLDVRTIVTINERDFRVVRPRHIEAFVLAP